jgi:hypothetical protein
VSSSQYADKLLSEIEAALVASQSQSPFPKFKPDISPAQAKVVHDYIARLRAQLIRILDSQGVPIISAPMMSCATVPTTISERAVDILNQIDSIVATKASTSHSAAENQTCSMSVSDAQTMLYRDSAWKPLQHFRYRSHWPLGSGGSANSTA